MPNIVVVDPVGWWCCYQQVLMTNGGCCSLLSIISSWDTKSSSHSYALARKLMRTHTLTNGRTQTSATNDTWTRINLRIFWFQGLNCFYRRRRRLGMDNLLFFWTLVFIDWTADWEGRCCFFFHFQLELALSIYFGLVLTLLLLLGAKQNRNRMRNANWVGDVIGNKQQLLLKIFRLQQYFLFALYFSCTTHTYLTIYI